MEPTVYSSGTATRMTCFALLSSVEADLREHIRILAERTGRADILPPDVRQNAKRRREADGITLAVNSDSELLDYMDFADIAKALQGFRASVDPGEAIAYDSLAKSLERLTPARNRVCHSRPLEPTDFAEFSDFAAELRAQQKMISCPETIKTLELLSKDPSFVIHLTIPTYWAIGSSRIRHNLPLPEFDDTGFLGRVSDRREVLKQLRSNHPVMTITGEGGVGKTALAQRCLYDLLEADDATVDIIVWISLKSRFLTPSGIRDIREAITTSIGIAQTATVGLGSPMSSDDISVLISEIREYMSTFKVIIAIDNYETIEVDNLRPLFVSIPTGSKILLTSRTGLGEFEVRYKLDALDTKTAIALGRRYARFLNSDLLARLPDNRWEQICASLFSNPLLIKWFVSSVSAGANIEQFQTRSHPDFKSALKFCFENLFARLDDAQKLVVWVIASTRRPLSPAELNFLLKQQKELSQHEIDWALSRLHNSSMLKRSFVQDRDSEERRTEYALTDFAAEYVAKCEPPDPAIFAGVQEALKKLRELAELTTVREQSNPYSPNMIHARTVDQRISAAYLNRAIQLLAVGDIEGAKALVAEARILTPPFGEVYRIAAMIEVEAGDYFRASEEYTNGIAIDIHSPYLRYGYGLLLQQYLENIEASLVQVEEALKIDPGQANLLWLKARSLTLLGQYEAAASIYEELLKDPFRFTRRLRIVLRDQVAECYRRWAEADFTRTNRVAIVKHLHRGSQILEQSFAADEADMQMGMRYIEIAENAISYSAILKEPAFALRTLKRLTAAKGFVWGLSFAHLRRETLIQRFAGEDEILNLMDKLQMEGVIKFADAGISAGDRDSGEKVKGVIYSLPAGMNYGFIRDTKQASWFFHKTHLLNGELWPRLKVGMFVTFLPRSKDGKKLASGVEVSELKATADQKKLFPESAVSLD